ncbi:MAG: hypothetical protein ACRETY_06730 [Steroidobacteraceae bacterium]
MKSAEEKCACQAAGTDFLSTRKLVPESFRVFPIVWKEEGGVWRLARALSYDHVLAP